VLLATADLSLGFLQIYLENTGPAELQRVSVMDGKRSLGILSKLVPGERKVLAVNGAVDKIRVKATDASGREIWGTVRYVQQDAQTDFPSPPEDEPLSTLSADEPSPDVSGEPAVEAGDVTGSPGTREASPLGLYISANKTEGLAGEAIGYRCTARNEGPSELSGVRIYCQEKMASTKFLPPGKELYLEGILLLENDVDLSASAQGEDARGNLFTNNTTVTLREISPKIRLEMSAPSRVHRGEVVPLAVRIENSGQGNLTDIVASDSQGEIGRIGFLVPGGSQVLQGSRKISGSLDDFVRVVARDERGNEIYCSQSFRISVLNSSLQISSQPSEIRAYAGEPVEATWVLSNTGEEILRNVTLSGDGSRCMLRELPPGRSVRMAAIYSKNSTCIINVTAQGQDDSGYTALAEGSIQFKSIRPGISLKVMPPQLEVCPGETAKISALVTNSGDDALNDVVLSQDGSILARLDRIEAGEFKLVESMTVISSNTTIQFEAAGKDSRGQIWSDSASVRASVVVSALKLFLSASPPAVPEGGKVNLTCTVANTGSVPLGSIFIISKQMGPLGNIDYLAPKRQMVVYSEVPVTREINDVVSAEGFTQEKKPVRGSCSLHISVLPFKIEKSKDAVTSQPAAASAARIAGANVSCGNTSMTLRLPDQEETAVRVSKEMASDVNSNAVRSTNAVLDGLSNLLRYVERIIGRDGQATASAAAGELEPSGKDTRASARDYELSIAGVKGSEHGAISVLDVSASPSQPAAGEAVKISAHIRSQAGIKSASVKYGLSDSPLTKQDMLGVDRVYDSPLRLESGDSRDGYWSCTIPGKAAGVYMALSVWMSDGSSSAEGGPYMLHWSTVNSAAPSPSRTEASSMKNGMLFIESSSVKGRGEVSIKDTFQGSAMHYNEKMIGNGSISLETLRCIDRKSTEDNFTERKDLVFTGGNLKGHQTVESPRFHGGLGASVTERFNLSHVDRSESSSVSSASVTNNTLAFKTDQAFDGTWNIQTKYAKFFKKIKADQQYTGSFQTQKTIKFQDAGQK